MAEDYRRRMKKKWKKTRKRNMEFEEELFVRYMLDEMSFDYRMRQALWELTKRRNTRNYVS